MTAFAPAAPALTLRQAARRRPLSLPLLATLAVPAASAFVARVLSGPHTIDDAYITFRYARNLAEGMGLVYNPGEWVLGTTTPAWAILLAAGYRLGFTDLPRLATVLSAACDAASAALLAGCAVRLGCGRPGALLVGLAWALNPMSVAFATGGMETSLFVMLCLSVLVLVALPPSIPDGRPRRPSRLVVWATAATRGPAHLPAAALIAGLGVLVRPESLLLLGVVVAFSFSWLRARRQLVWVAAAGLLPVLGAAVALAARYGSPLPNSIVAKEIAYARPDGPSLENALAFVMQSGLPGGSTYLLAALPGMAGFAVACIGAGTFAYLVALAVRRLHGSQITWQPFALFGVLYLGFYVAAGLRGVRLFPWYLVPIEPFYLLAACAGLVRVARVPWLGGLLLLLWQLPAIDWRQPPQPVGQSLVREQLLVDVGQALAPTLRPDALVAAPEIGALGYASDARMLDTTGLVSPAALAYYPLPDDQLVADNAIPSALIREEQPEAVVTFDAFAQRTLLQDPEFLREYRLVQSIRASVWQSERLLVFRRAVDVAP